MTSLQEGRPTDCSVRLQKSGSCLSGAADSSFSQIRINLAPQIGESMKVLSETIARVKVPRIVIPSEVFAPYRELQNCLAAQRDSFFDTSSAVHEALKPLTTALSEAINQINWQSLGPRFENFRWDCYKDGAACWGRYGWPISYLPFSDVCDPPSTFQEANALYSSILTDDEMCKLLKELEQGVRKKRDLQECVELFRQRHYKPCAMMLCSLIEGQLILEMPKGEKRRNGKAALEKAKRDVDCFESDAMSLVWLNNCLTVHDYFFHNANNFNRDIEGELNRNFLMHGMMYKPVRKQTCKKLFLLLHSSSAVFEMLKC